MTAEEEAKPAEALDEIDGPLKGNVSLDETIPTGGQGAVTELPPGGQVVGELDLDCIGSSFKRIEIGLNKETGDVAIKAIGFDNQYEMMGFIQMWCRPDVIIENLNKPQG